MKTPIHPYFFVLLTALSIACDAQTTSAPLPTPWTITSRSANLRTWQSTSYEVLSSGQTIPRVQSYSEIANGICYPGPNGQWLDSEEIIRVLDDGSAAATNGVCQAFFPPDIYSGSIQLKSGEVLLNGQPQCLIYSDGTNYVVLGVLTNSIGELISSNELLYPGAISGPGVEADLMMTYRRSGIEQDVIFRAKPPTPEQFGLTSAYTRLQLLTEFLDSPTPQAAAEPVNPQGELQDTTLTFGNIRMIQGRAFLVGNHQQNNVQFPIFKSWQAIDADTSVLVEQLPYSQIASSLSTLPPPTAARNVRSRLCKVASEWTLPKRTARMVTAKVKIARIQQKPGFTLDYTTINAQSLTNYVFQGDSTYYVSGPAYLYGTTIVEGGTTIKMNGGGEINIESGGTVDCLTGPYFPAIFTSYNDNSVGYWFGSGSPAMGDANTFLNFYSTNVVLHDLHFAYQPVEEIAFSRESVCRRFRKNSPASCRMFRPTDVSR